MGDNSAVICGINLKFKPPLSQPKSVYLYKNAYMQGLQEQLRNSYASSKRQINRKKEWTQFKAIPFDTIKKP